MWKLLFLHKDKFPDQGKRHSLAVLCTQKLLLKFHGKYKKKCNKIKYDKTKSLFSTNMLKATNQTLKINFTIPWQM